MNAAILSAIALALASCAGAQYLEKGTHDGIEVAYRWNHPPGKPSELLLRLKNTASTDRSIALAIDLYYQGRTVESFEADTCLRPGMLLTGKLNGIYFIPERLTTDQIKDGGAQVEVTRTDVTKAPCP
jgi:hypothetical protein